jgi:geranylgeranyl pyrophosphate synthase
MYEGFAGKKDKRILLPSLCLELFHASSLVHDDIMDEDVSRRNYPSMHKAYQDWFLKNFNEREYAGNIFTKDSLRFSTSAGIVQGNILFSLGLASITHCEFEDGLKREVLNLIQTAYREVNDGQLLDLLYESKKETNEEDYITMAALKTGKLFVTSLLIGAIFARATEEQKTFIQNFGMSVAIAFQIHDDIMDIDETMKKGNTLGSDIRKGKKTLLMIYALEEATTEERIYLGEVSGKSDASKEEIEKVVKIFERTGAIEKTKALADKYVSEGKMSLERLKREISAEGFEFFNQLADYMTKRKI